MVERLIDSLNIKSSNTSEEKLQRRVRRYQITMFCEYPVRQAKFPSLSFLILYIDNITANKSISPTRSQLIKNNKSVR